jgi:CBS domain-containing protein
MPVIATELGPTFEHATVADAMRRGVVSCSAGTGLREVAGVMASYRVHAVLVEDVAFGDGSRGWGIVSDMDVVSAAAAGGLERTAGELARPDILSVSPEEPLAHVASLMSEHGASHVVVADPSGSRPAGIVSTIDLAEVIAWGRA